MLNEQLIARVVDDRLSARDEERAVRTNRRVVTHYRLFGALCVLATTAVVSTAQGVIKPQTASPLEASALVEKDEKAQQIVLPKELKDLTEAGFNQAMYCFAELFDKDATGSPKDCAASSQKPLQVLIAVMLVFGLFLFAPFYLFPEATFALALRKGFPHAMLPFFPALGNAPAATIAAVQDTLFNVVIACLAYRVFFLWFGSSKDRPDWTYATFSVAVSAGMFYWFHALLQ